MVEKLEFDYSKLCGRIIEMCGNRKKFAKEINVSPTTLSLKLNNRVYFSQTEIHRAIQVLGIEPGYVDQYFFTLKL